MALLDSRRFTRAREVFDELVDVRAEDRELELLRQTGEDEALREDVRSLLAHHDGAGAFLSARAIERMHGLLSEEDGLASGAVIGSYTVDAEIGRGGMGRVYRARDARLGRTVALKALAPGLVGDEPNRERLRREARAAAALAHPGICTVYALEEIDGQLFIASELIDGRTLRAEIDERVRPSAQAVADTARELAAALAAAHAARVVHRDLKPENVMRSATGHLKILDFGLARVDDSGQPLAVRVTAFGAFAGTPAYMAPEQLNGGAVDFRTDVFAAGVLLYEYASGRHPFDAPTPLALAGRILEATVSPLAQARPDLSPTVVSAVERCLAKSPADRFPTAADLVRALERADEPATPLRRAGWWQTHQVATMALYVLGCAIGWKIKDWRHLSSDALFLVLGATATAGGVFRGHLLFTARWNTAALAAEARLARRMLLPIDLLFAAALGADALLLGASHALFSMLTASLAVGIALSRLVLEPATTRAAFPAEQPPGAARSPTTGAHS